MSNSVVDTPGSADSSPVVEDLPDTQNERDSRGFAIQRVGIRGLRMPAKVVGVDGEIQGAAATFDLSVDLAADRRGTHMSRFVELIQGWDRPWSATAIPEFMAGFRDRFDCRRAYAKIAFPFFYPKVTPVSRRETWSECEAIFEGELKDERISVTTTVVGSVKTLCPCSKAISEYGAHNQRGRARVRVNGPNPVEVGALIDAVESSGSSPLYPLLKRSDEKAVTELAYQNPVFVEDLVRNVAVQLRANPDVHSFEVEAENFESIHAHNAHAILRYPES